jgi:hypothetical protein
MRVGPYAILLRGVSIELLTLHKYIHLVIRLPATRYFARPPYNSAPISITFPRFPLWPELAFISPVASVLKSDTPPRCCPPLTANGLPIVSEQRASTHAITLASVRL